MAGGENMLRGVVWGTHHRLLILMLLSTLGCGDRKSAPLRIAAASDLQSALPKLADRFQAKTGIEITLTFGASGQLSEQIKNGSAPSTSFWLPTRLCSRPGRPLLDQAIRPGPA